MNNFWYAVLENKDDNDWGYGSCSLNEAKKMCLELESEYAYIAVIDDDGFDSLCIAEIRQSEFEGYDE